MSQGSLSVQTPLQQKSPKRPGAVAQANFQAFLQRHLVDKNIQTGLVLTATKMACDRAGKARIPY